MTANHLHFVTLCRFEISKGRDMSKILNIAFLGKTVSAEKSQPREISFSGYQFHIWAVLEIIAYSAWYIFLPASFVLAVSLLFNLPPFHLTPRITDSHVFDIFCNICFGLLGDNGPQKRKG